MKQLFPSTLVLTLFLATSQSLLGQNSQSRTSRDLISEEAFSKMVTDYYNFSILGSQTPTTGFKVETNKPSIALKGNIISKNYRRFVTNFELEGGLDNGLMQFVSGKNVSSYLKASLGFNFLLPSNSARFLELTQTEHDMNDNAFRTNKKKLLTQVDSFIVIMLITDSDSFASWNFDQFVSAVESESEKNKFTLDNYTRQYNGDRNAHYKAFIRRILTGYSTLNDADNNVLLNNFRGSISNIDSTAVNTRKILEDYDRLKEAIAKDDQTLRNRQYDFEINLTRVNWTWKRIHWINGSVSGSNSNFKLYDNTNTINPLTDSNSFTHQVSLSYNLLFKGKEASQFIFFRSGASLIRANSLPDLSRYSYKKETTINLPNNEQLKSTKEGIAYEGELVEKMGFELFAELYYAPWKTSFIPGFYLKTMYRNSKAWINPQKVPVELGLIWNVVSSNKEDKNLISIIPYVGWSNLIKEYKDNTKTQTKKLSELFSFNVKFGIPVNLGK